jgi:hypothetical protein
MHSDNSPDQTKPAKSTSSPARPRAKARTVRLPRPFRVTSVLGQTPVRTVRPDWRLSAHALAICGLMIPLAAHYFSLETRSGFSIGELVFPRWLSFTFIVGLAAMVCANFGAMLWPGLRRFTAVASGAFFLMVAVIQFTRVAIGFKMVVVGHRWVYNASIREGVLLGLFACILLWVGVQPAGVDGEARRNSVAGIVSWVRSAPSYVAELLGLVTAAFVGVPLAMLALGLSRSALSPALFPAEDISRLAWVGVVGAQGAAVSVLMRPNRSRRCRDNFLLHYSNALFKPFIGMTFAHLSYTLLRATGNENLWVMVSVAFAAGFSERFAKDLISSASHTGE